MDHHEDTPKTIAGYTPTSRLGSGSFATVYKAMLNGPSHNENELPTTAAIKSIVRSKKLTPKVLANLHTEISILRNHRHPNIVRLFRVSETKECVYLILEYCSGGDLQHLIRTRKKGRLGERLCRRLVRDLACGLGFLWDRHLVHRDIKPQNLLLTCALPREEAEENPPREIGSSGNPGVEENGEFTLKIADFGFARHLGGVDLAETMCGSPLYMAPEILLGQKYDAKADLWSVGTVLFEMISGRTPFHGENHMDLLNNIKRKAVRLPPDVRVSKECVALLRILLDRRPASRADFRAFYEAVEKFVALGCNGSKVEVATHNGEEMMPLKAQMDLCAITEDDAESEMIQTEPLKETKARTTEGIVQIVTPPFKPVTAPAPPPTMYSGVVQGVVRQNRPSLFAPLQGSPNLSSAPTPVTTHIPTLSLQDGGAAIADSRNLIMRVQQKNGSASSTPNGSFYNTRRDSQPSSSSSAEAYDSGFVLVEHSGSRGLPSSTSTSPSNSITRAPPSPGRKYDQAGLSRSSTASPKYASSRMIVTGNMGMLGTSPATGQALVGKMLSGSPQTSSGLSAAPIVSGRFNISPRTALRNGGCLAHIESLARMLAASEDIARRAISVAHLGDVRAYHAMGLLVAQRDGSQSSSSSCIPMELEEDGSGTNARLSLRGKLSKKTIFEEDEEDELPFAMTTSMDDASKDEMSQSPADNIFSNLEQLIGKRTNPDPDNPSNKEQDTPAMIRVHFREALLCYVKTLSMIKGSICAAQKVLKDVEEVNRLPSIHPSPNSNNPYTPLHKRCSGSLEWLRTQFQAVLERADAATDQIFKLEKASNSQGGKDSVATVEELIYNHSLKCGRDGTVQQVLGHYDAARSCYRSAGLLAETLLMDPKISDEDRAILEGYVQSFADQIMELDGLIHVQQRSSRVPTVHDTGSNASGMRDQSATVPTAK